MKLIHAYHNYSQGVKQCPPSRFLDDKDGSWRRDSDRCGFGLFDWASCGFSNDLREHDGEHRGIRDVESPRGVQIARSAHRPRPGLGLWCGRQHSGTLGGDSRYQSCQVADSLDLHALVVTCRDDCTKFDDVLIGIRRFGSERSHRGARESVPCLRITS